MDTKSILASFGLLFMLVWIVFLIYDYQTRTSRPSVLVSLGMYFHIIPALSLFVICRIAQYATDSALVWFFALAAFRYWRTLTNIFFWFRYRPATSSNFPEMMPYDCTVVVPTVGPRGNQVYDEMVAAILMNKPLRLIFSTNTDSAAKDVEERLPTILSDIRSGHTIYQLNHKLAPIDPQTEIVVLNAQISNKRQQVVHAFSRVETEVLVMVDDTAIWNPGFLMAALPAFDNTKVGFVGTRKWVKRLPRAWDSSLPLNRNLWNSYWEGFWNCMGGLYLVRHNFEIRATNAADGGVFCVSGRSSLIRTSIVNNPTFKNAFLNEYILRFSPGFPGWGPVNADDDNFITRWVINSGWDVKIQSSEAATMTTVIGQYPQNFKFISQCTRWSRTTFRQNPIALFADRTVWHKWPLTVWTTLFPWLYNAAFIWDSLLVYTLYSSDWLQQSTHPRLALWSLVGFIWATKLVKTVPWFWAYPMDFVLYYMIPAYPLFAYYHSFLKVFTAFTFWDLAWSGRRLPPQQQQRGRIAARSD
jgi:hypothetical protein